MKFFFWGYKKMKILHRENLLIKLCSHHHRRRSHISAFCQVMMKWKVEGFLAFWEKIFHRRRESWENVKRSDLLFDNDMFMGIRPTSSTTTMMMTTTCRWRKLFIWKSCLLWNKIQNRREFFCKRDMKCWWNNFRY